SPGWRRLKENARSGVSEAPRTIEGSGELLAASGGPSAFKIGQRVFHDKFGYGRVAAAEGSKLTVDFEKTGRKKVISTFLIGA
ncbi:MAG: DNA helicase II, partial [Pseudomonadota bacterium]